MARFAHHLPKGLLFFVAFVAVFPIGAKAQTKIQPRPLSSFLESQNWVALPIPDNKMRPGAVISVVKKNTGVEVRWLGDFRTCGVADKDLGLVRGKYPEIGIGESFAVSASFGINLLSKLGGTAEVGKVNGAILKIDESGGDAIDLLALSIWLSKPGNLQSLPEACIRLLSMENVFLVGESFRITKGSYDLVDQNGTKIAASAAMGGRSASAEISGAVSSTGSLNVVEDFYFGVRRVKLLSPGTFATLGNSSQAVPEADGLLREVER